MRSHRATLLHYVGANGVEDYRQRSPQNAVAVAEALLAAGAEVDAVVALLVASGATVEPGLLADEAVRADLALLAALHGEGPR